MKPETQEWLNIVERDLGAADVLLQGNFYAQANFYSQQAVEKCLKALWVEQHTAGYPPRIHDLTELLADLDFTLPEWDDFLKKLAEEAVASRYADPATYSRTRAVQFVEGAKALCVLLQQKLS